ncbi:MAG: 8-amino-7-oxononanoate synthase [Chloroflexota bacterium]
MRWLSDALRILDDKGLLRTIHDRSADGAATGDRLSPVGSRIRIGDRGYVNFGSNDYLGLAGDRRSVESAREALDRFGAGAGASRLLAGGCDLHRELEYDIADFKGAESAVIFNSGYAANTGAIPALAGEDTLILSDELNHASIIDGVRLSRARRAVYRHRDMDHLSSLLSAAAETRKMVVTDTVFSMDGDIAPLQEICELCARHGSLLYLDDAHGTGVLGEGRGALAHFRLSPQPWIIQMGTFSKALGSYGAFIVASREVTGWLSSTARSFMFSTALPPPVVAASLAAVRILREDTAAVRRLWRNRERLAAGLRERGFDIHRSESPILPVTVGDTAATVSLSGELRARNLYVPAIRPPTVREPRLRITVTATHSEEDLDLLLAALSEVRGCMRSGASRG